MRVVLLVLFMFVVSSYAVECDSLVLDNHDFSVKKVCVVEKPTLVVLKKTGCKFYNKFRKTIDGESKLAKYFHRSYNLVYVDKYKDHFDNKYSGRISPSFLLLDKDGVITEIEGMTALSELQDAFEMSDYVEPYVEKDTLVAFLNIKM